MLAPRCESRHSDSDSVSSSKEFESSVVIARPVGLEEGRRCSKRASADAGAVLFGREWIAKTVGIFLPAKLVFAERGEAGNRGP